MFRWTKTLLNRQKQPTDADYINDAEIVPSLECVNCGSLLVERNGKYGRFLGCSRYPNCTYTKSWSDYIWEKAIEDENIVVVPTKPKITEEPIQKKGLFRKIIAVVLSCLAVIVAAPITIMSWSIDFIKSMIGSFLFWIVGKVCVTIVLFLVLELLDRFKLVPEGILMSFLEGYSVHVLGMSNGEIVSTFLFPYFDIEIWLIVGLAAIIATMNTFRKPKNY
ncbi:TPA: topoisomerase DNA-binding C4 zinc finger domain-containing protein [Streptococcus suis]